jgi:hypothetical protein
MHSRRTLLEWHCQLRLPIQLKAEFTRLKVRPSLGAELLARVGRIHLRRCGRSSLRVHGRALQHGPRGEGNVSMASHRQDASLSMRREPVGDRYGLECQER